MASNEDILMQFTAEDEISSVVEAMESTITASLEAINSAVADLDGGFTNLIATAESVSSAFGEMESAFGSAEDSATSFQSSLDNIDGGNISDVTSDVSELSDTIMEASGEVDNLSTNLSTLDGTSISVDIEASGIGGGDGGGFDSTSEFESENTAQDTSTLKTSLYDDLVGMSGNIKEVGQVAVDSASAAEQGWLRFGNAVDNNGGDWDAQSDSIKSWVKDFSNSMGRGVADTRTAMTTFMNMGMPIEQTQETMKVVTNYAAQFGITQSQAAQSIQMAFMGAGRGIKRLGLDIKDFKDEAGNVDREKLLQAMMEKTSGAAEKYSNTYEARVQKMNNAINSLRTDFGKEIINTIEPLLPIVQEAFKAFTNLPGPIKGTILGFAGLAGGAAMVAGPLIKMRAYMRMGGVEMGTFKKGLDVLKTGYKELSGGGGIGSAIKAMKDFTTAQKAAETASATGGLGKATGAGKGMTTVATEAEKTVGSAGKVGGLAGPANAAGAGMQSTSAGLKGIGQGAMSMLVPLLEIAVVVAVLIPVIAALAAEALIFLKGIQLLIDALDFDSIDLSGTIAAIKQIGQALLEMGIAMAEMTFANVMTGLAVLTSGVTGIINPVQVAGQLLIQAGQELAKFKAVNIDNSIPAKLQSISQALGAVSSAMMSLTNVVLSMALGNLLTLGGRLGTVTSAIITARTEIVNAGKEIAKIKDVPDLDKGAIDKLKKISESLESVAKAMDGLRSIRDSNNFDISGFIGGLFGGVNIQEALNDVKQDIIDAGTALQSFTGLPDIPDGVGEKLKKIADSLSSVGKAMGTLRTLRDDTNWDNLTGIFKSDIVSSLIQVRGTLRQSATVLNTFTSIPDIQDGIYTKVNRVATSTRNVANALKTMSNAPFPNLFGMVMIPVNIQMGRDILTQAATQLNSLAGIQSIQDGIYTKVMRVGTSTRVVATALRNMSSSPFPDIVSMALLPVRIASARLILQNTGSELNKLSALPVIPEDLSTKVTRIGVVSSRLGVAASLIRAVPFIGPDVALRVQSAIRVVRNVAGQLNGLQGLNIGGGIGAALASVRNAIIQLRATVMSMGGGFRSAGVNIGANLRAGIRAGLAGLSGVVVSSVSAGINAGIGPAQAGGTRIGAAGKTGFQTNFKLAQVAAAELQEATTALQNGTSSFLQVVADIARQAVETAKTESGHHSPGHIARMWGDEMGYSAMLLRGRSSELIRGVRDVTRSVVTAGAPLSDAFSLPELDMARINTLRNMNARSSMGKAQRPVSIQIGEGAVQLDARNMTTKESRQIMINALEGLDVINGIDVRSV